jgi:hypothetical protein
MMARDRPPHRILRAPLLPGIALLCMLLTGLAPALPGGAAWGQDDAGLRKRFGDGLTLLYAEPDSLLAERLWPRLVQDRLDIMDTLGVSPPGVLRIVLAPSDAVFAQFAPGQGRDTLGVYLLGHRVIALRSPRASAAQWDLRGVARHELVHGVLDLAVEGPIPRWLNEGLALLVAGDIDFLDDARLNLAAVTGQLIPLSRLVYGFPDHHGGRSLAYAQAASFSRFLLGRGGMPAVQALVVELSGGAPAHLALARVYGESLEALEAEWKQARYAAFSWASLIGGTSLLGLLGVPLLVAGRLRRAVVNRRKLRELDAEEHMVPQTHAFPPPQGTGPLPRGYTRPDDPISPAQEPGGARERKG